jgi:CheY-like chemotaxis protein
MNRSTLILILPDDPLTGLLILSSLPAYGYDALVTGSLPEALALLEANRRIGVLVVNADLAEGRGLALAKSARAINPKLAVIYTSHMPQRVPEREKVTGAPCLRIPYHPHQLVGVIGQLTGRLVSDDEVQVA